MSVLNNDALFVTSSKESIHSTLFFPVKKASSLLDTEMCQLLLEILQVLLTKSAFTTFYLPVIERFSEYVQVLPSKHQGPFAALNGFLDYSLSRATYALTFALTHLYAGQKNFYQLKPKSYSALELYTTFTAALFLNIEQLISHYEIKLYDSNKNFMKVWNPFEGSMQEQDAVFYRFQNVNTSTAYYFIASALSSFILSKHNSTKKGFDWMTQHSNIYESWLAFLNHDEGERIPISALLGLIPFADKQAIDKKLQFLKERKQNQSSLFYDNQRYSKQTETFQHTLGNQFLNWLKERIALGKLIINQNKDSQIKKTREGILIDRSELIHFSELHKVDSKIVEQQFSDIVALYPASTNERARLDRQGGVTQAALSQWLLVHNPALIFGLGNIPSFFLSNTPLQLANALNNTTHLPK